MKQKNARWVDLDEIAPYIHCNPRIALKRYMIRYLKFRNIYNEFYHNIKTHGHYQASPSLCFESHDVQSPRDILQKAFVWFDTNDYDKWLRIHCEIGIPWGRLVKKWLRL